MEITTPSGHLRVAAPAPDEMQAILGPYPPTKMDTYPVSTRINSPAEDNDRLIDPLS